jgi:hypothetical protein
MNANAIAYGSPGGGALTSDALLTAAPIDPLGRPQILDRRPNAMWRIGAWEMDGDPASVTCTGMVQYGSNAFDLGPDGTRGGYLLTGPHGFGIYEIVPGVNGGNTFLECGFEDGSAQAPYGYNGFFVYDNANICQFAVNRNTGFVGIGTNTQLSTELVNVAGALAVAGEVRIVNSTNYVGFTAPVLAGNTVWTLPATDGAAGDVLQTDGNKTLSWISNTGFVVVSDSYNDAATHDLTSILLDNNTNYILEAYIIGRRHDGTVSEHVGYLRRAMIFRNSLTNLGNATLALPVDTSFTREEVSNISDWEATIAVKPTDNHVYIQVTGPAVPINWEVSYFIRSLS